MPRLRTLPRPRHAGIDPQASSVQVWHFLGQKLRLGGDALGADPTYLLYLAYRSRGELRRIDFEPDCAGATLGDFAASEWTRKPLLRNCVLARSKSWGSRAGGWAEVTRCIAALDP